MRMVSNSGGGVVRPMDLGYETVDDANQCGPGGETRGGVASIKEVQNQVMASLFSELSHACLDLLKG
jgi:hypothetical protein